MMKSMPRKSHRHRRGGFRGTPLLKCLTECDKGEETRVLRVETGFKAKRRLADLGIVPGSVIKKKREAPFHGPLEVIVKGSKIALGRGLASHIFVECDNECPS